MKYLFFLFLICSCSTHNSLDRELSSRRAISTNVVAGFGNIDCLASGNKSDLRDLEITLSGANREEKKVVYDIVTTIRDLAGDHHSKVLIRKMNINYKNYLPQRSDGHCLPGNFGLTTRGAIDLARKCHPKSPEKNIKFSSEHLRGSLIHEIGHVVGNRSFEGKTFYQRYNSEVKGICKVSRYTTQSNAGNKHRNRNEEFAEVWAAYIYATDSLKSKCRKAYQFMKESVFNNSSHSCRALK